MALGASCCACTRSIVLRLHSENRACLVVETSVMHEDKVLGLNKICLSLLTSVVVFLQVLKDADLRQNPDG